MKKVLVIGENSYIGKSFEAFVKDRFEIKMVSSRDGAWKNVDFTGYDSVLHCAGIAHNSRNPKMEPLYYEINCDLAVDVANKAKRKNVGHFIFLSSILIYGSVASEISDETSPDPDDFYGNSKLKAEQELQKLSDDRFRLCIIRPPMVYGNGCKGNFPRLVKLAKRTPVFPDYPNNRSMIYIENLCSFLCGIIDNNNYGTFLPQNKEWVNTTDLVWRASRLQSKRIRMVKLINPIITLLLKHSSSLNKMFGNLTYAHTGDEGDYNIVEFEESIKRSIPNN